MAACTVSSIKHQHPTDCRAELINKETGRIEYYYIGNFANGKAKYDRTGINDLEKSTVTLAGNMMDEFDEPFIVQVPIYGADFLYN